MPATTQPVTNVITPSSPVGSAVAAPTAVTSDDWELNAVMACRIENGEACEACQ